MIDEPDWVRHAIWWQLYPLGFVDAYPQHPDQTAATPDQHRLGWIADWLDHARDLGASGVALGPIFASTTHGYDTIDHLMIDPRLGDDDDFDRLVAEAHRRGLRVLLDGVFNHVSRAHPLLVEALAAGPQSDASSWFRPRSPADPSVGPYELFEGHPGLVALNHANPAVADYVVAVMSHWLARGADGWRLDAAYAVPSSFWAEVLPRVRRDHPDAWFVGELIHGDYAAIVEAGRLDSATQYELWKAIWSSIDVGNFFELDWALQRHAGFLATFVPATFIGNHDVTRIATRILDRRHLPHALVVLLTVGGTPSLYAGDEYGYRATKEDRAGGDDAIRPAFRRGGPGEVDAEARAVFRLHQDLIGLRRRHPWLHTATTRKLQLTNEQYVYEAGADGATIVVMLNLSDRMLRVDLPALGLRPQTVIAGRASWSAEDRIEIEPHGWAISEPRARS